MSFVSATVIEGLDFSSKLSRQATRLLQSSTASPQDLSAMAYQIISSLNSTSTELEYARTLLEKAAELGDVVGLYNLALSYLHGRGGKIEEHKALSLFWQLATDSRCDDRTKADCLTYLGKRALTHPQADYINALSLLETAGNYGSVEACYFAGLVYEGDFHDFQDFEKAAYWYGLAQPYHSGASFRLGRLHVMGVLIQSNPTQGVQWVKSSLAEIPEAQQFFDLYCTPNAVSEAQ